MIVLEDCNERVNKSDGYTLEIIVNLRKNNGKRLIEDFCIQNNFIIKYERVRRGSEINSDHYPLEAKL